MTQAAQSPRQTTSGATEGALEMHSRMTDLKIAASEARTETKFAQLMGKLDVLVTGVGDLKTEITRLDGKIDTVDGHARAAKTTIVATVIGTGIAVAALAWAGVQIFQGGMGLSGDAFTAGMDAAQVERAVDQPQTGD
jgi:hypothetical protein